MHATIHDELTTTQEKAVRAMKSSEFIRLATAAAAMSFATAAFSYNSRIDMLVTQPDGLHKAALASGGTYQAGGLSPPKYLIPDLNNLVADSSTIVVASVRNATAILKDDGRFISTNYQLEILETIKGDFASAADLLEMPGGTYKFSDGSVVIQVEPVWKALQAGTTYILFLKRWDDQPDHFRVVGAGQGIYEITFDREHLISHTHLENDPLSDDVSLGKAGFLEKVKSIVANKKQ
jgi:hypothetical protein